MSHETRVVRRNGPGNVWWAVCSDGCPMQRPQSKEQAEWIAERHHLTAGIDEARPLVPHEHNQPYDTASMEYGPAQECPRCLLDALVERAS